MLPNKLFQERIKVYMYKEYHERSTLDARSLSRKFKE